jgi:hypothetical protein
MEIEEARAEVTPPTRLSLLSAPWRQSSSQLGAPSEQRDSTTRRVSTTLTSVSRRRESSRILDQMSPLVHEGWDEGMDQPNWDAFGIFFALII